MQTSTPQHLNHSEHETGVALDSSGNAFCYTYISKDRSLISKKARVVTDRTHVSTSEENASQAMVGKVSLARHLERYNLMPFWEEGI